MKKICIFILLLLQICSLYGCSIIDYKEYGDFKYKIVYLNEKNEYCTKFRAYSSHIAILRLTEEGKSKKTLIIPEYIDGYIVKQLGNGGIGAWLIDANLSSMALEKIYIPFSISLDGASIGYYKTKIIRFSKSTGDNNILANTYFNSFNYNPVYSLTNHYTLPNSIQNCFFANVSYFYNYEDSINDGYYWIDDYDYGSKIEYIPENPERSGYTFLGWYKEKECINKWDFDKDTLPEVIYLDTGEEMYQETKLYAKWSIIK